MHQPENDLHTFILRLGLAIILSIELYKFILFIAHTQVF